MPVIKPITELRNTIEVFGEIPKELEPITWNDEPIELEIKFEIKS